MQRSFWLILLCAAAEADPSCPCSKDSSLCEPLTTPAASREIFAFVTGTSWRQFLSFRQKPTTIAFFGTPTAELVCTAHQHGVRVVIGTEFAKDQLANASARAAYVSKTVASGKAAGLDGFNIDIEGNSANRDQLTALITELAAAARTVNPHSQISFDLGIYPKNQVGGYDHAALSKVLDFIVPMAYDECWGSSVARANSPLSALAIGMKQYADLGVPAEKLVIGLPWYGWDFPCDSASSYGVCRITVPKGKEWYGYAKQISYNEANITATHGYRMDKASTTIITEYFQNVGGAEERHQQWFDNPETLAMKYAEVGRLGGKGVAFWTADEVDYTTPQGFDMWAAVSHFKALSGDVIV